MKFATKIAMALLGSVVGWVPGALAEKEFRLEKGDRICLMGNGLAERMQHDGWLETLFQWAHPELELVFRNLGFPGDRVNDRPRCVGYETPEEYLKLCEADVIFAFFGYNESFDGEAGVGKFEEELGAMVDSYRALQPNGKSEPRIVLFAPAAQEDLRNANLPPARASEGRLAKYAEAVGRVAAAKGTAYVDLFAASQRIFAGSEEALTINGIHWTAEGNRRLAEVIVGELTGKVTPPGTDLEKVREAVNEKDWYWFNRYRATDGNDIWGTRAGLAFVDGQTNREVLVHELVMLDALTANRDPKVWARARGGDLEVSDGKVPPPVPVISNVGGGSKSSSAEKEGNLNYLPGGDGIAQLEVPEGFAVNLFADESRFPELVNPVQMNVDGRGRLWVAAWKSYPKWEPLQPMEDALLIFPDDDGDGVADRVITFAKVHNPMAFEFWNGGVLVASQPDILFLKDTDGDDVADVSYVYMSGIGSEDTHHAANNFVYGPDGGIYWQSGIFLVNNIESPWGPSLKTGASGMFRFDPRRYTIAFHAANSPNPHGIAFDRWGYHYANDGTSGRTFQVRPEGKGFKMHEMLTKQVRPVAANEIVSSAHFPEEMQGDLLICNTIGYLGIKQYKLHRDGYSFRETLTEKDGTKKEVERTFAQGEVWGEPAGDLLVSKDKNFRPTDAVFGADGALYVADWHNVIIGHMQHNVRDPSRDHRHGRVYRMSYPSRPTQEAVAIEGATLDQLMRNLEHAVDGVRHRTRVELSGRPTDKVVAACQTWLARFDPTKREHAHYFLEGLWLHQQHNVRNTELLNVVLNSPEPHARIAAATVRHHWSVADPATGAGQAPVEEVEEKRVVEIPAHLPSSYHEEYRLGAEVFFREGHCATCHQANGLGLPNQYPPLVENNWVSGSVDRLIKLTLHGLWGEIVVNGVKYDPSRGVPPMTPFAALLKDHEMAAVLTYTRNSWGNRATPVSPEEVNRVREATKGRYMFWTPEELLKEHPMEP